MKKKRANREGCLPDMADYCRGIRDRWLLLLSSHWELFRFLELTKQNLLDWLQLNRLDNWGIVRMDTLPHEAWISSLQPAGDVGAGDNKVAPAALTSTITLSCLTCIAFDHCVKKHHE